MPDDIPIKWPTPGNTITTVAGMEYVIGPQLDQGGYALVFEGMDTFGHPVALKIYKPANRPFEDVREQWDREAALFEKLRHPNVVTIFDAFVCDNLFYIVLERAWGTLASLIRTNGKAPEGVVREMARQLLFAVHYMHTHGVLHRDITIYNTLVFEGPASRGATFKISDFGISKAFADPWQEKTAFTQIAHPSFVPPEHLLEPLAFSNERTDLYHVGLILLFALQGVLPFAEDLERSALDAAIRDGVPRKAAESIGTPFGDFIAILLRRHNDQRFASALAAWQALKASPASGV